VFRAATRFLIEIEDVDASLVRNVFASVEPMRSNADAADGRTLAGDGVER